MQMALKKGFLVLELQELYLRPKKIRVQARAWSLRAGKRRLPTVQHVRAPLNPKP